MQRTKIKKMFPFIRIALIAALTLQWSVRTQADEPTFFGGDFGADPSVAEEDEISLTPEEIQALNRDALLDRIMRESVLGDSGVGSDVYYKIENGRLIFPFRSYNDGNPYRSGILEGQPVWPAFWPDRDVDSVHVWVFKNDDMQKLALYVNGKFVDGWHVSTGARGHTTPTILGAGVESNGGIQKINYNHRSRKYGNAPMNWSVFIDRPGQSESGYAFHETPHIDDLGQRASHGCIRQTPNRAYWLHNYVANFIARDTVQDSEDATVRIWVVDSVLTRDEIRAGEPQSPQ